MVAPSIRWHSILSASAAFVTSFLQKAARRADVFLVGWLLLAGLGSAQAVEYVDVIVNSSLYAGGEITASINQYLSDITAKGYTPRLITDSFADPAALRTRLANEYSTYNIKGAVFVGDMPVEHFERNGQFGDPNDYQRFACDLYYMDLNGTWSDSTANGTYDTHTGNVAPEIWVSHIAPSSLTGLNPGQTEASLINNYFAKDHQYQIGQLRLPQSGLAYIDDDWSGDTAVGPALGSSVAGRLDTVNDILKTVPADYMAHLSPATSAKYESIVLMCHSGPDAHVFKTNYEWGAGNVNNTDLTTLDPQAFFYNLFACSNGNFEYTGGAMGLQYVFGTNMGLLSFSTTKTGSMLNFADYYTPLGQGANFGAAYLAWWNAQAAGGFEDWEKDWFYGNTLTGDPFLKTEAYTTAAVATWNGGTASWTNQGPTWTVGGSAFTWNNRGTGARFDSPAPATSIPIVGKIYTYGLTTSVDGYSFTGSSNDLLETLGGGITANGNTTINCPILLLDKQSWTVATGKTLTVGALHVLFSNLTVTGNGNTTITGPIDGGSIFGLIGGTASGSITKSGTGTLTLSGASNFVGNIAASAGTINFAPPSGVTATFSGTISGSGAIRKTDNGTVIFSGTNSYTSTTTVTGGALQADSGVGLPTASFLSLDGGVIQSNGTATTTFSRGLAGSGSGKFRLTTNGGGFSAGAGPMTVNVGGNTTPTMLTWANSGTGYILGTLKFGSLTAANVTTFQNPINLNGANRTIEVNDNLNSSADYAVMSGAISYGTGTAGIIKTGPGLLKLSGTNTYNGPTTISAGALQADVNVGLPANSLLRLNGGVFQSNAAITFTRSLGTGSSAVQWTANGGGFSGGAGAMTVNIGGNATPDSLVWGSNVGTQIVGVLKFGSASAANTTTFQNPIDLNGAMRTIEVTDNIYSTADTAVVSGVISNSSGTFGIQKSGTGLLLLTASNTYNGPTTISAGPLQADLGVGIPANSLLSLDGGVFQSNAAITFTRSLGSGDGAVQWTTNGGGFAGGAGPMIVNIGGNATPSMLVWGSNVGAQLVGTLKLSSTSATSTTTLQNSIDLGGGDRTIQVDDNPNVMGDNSFISGNITGSGSLTVSGTGLLSFIGSANSYTGSTTASCGILDLATSTGPAIPGNLNIVSASGPTQVRVQANNQISSSTVASFGGSTYESRLLLLGHSQVLAGISDSSGLGVVENTQDQTGVSNVTLTISNSSDYSFNGTLRNTATGSGQLALVKLGTNAQTLAGPNIAYTGGTTITSGRLILQDTTNAAFLAVGITNNASLEFNTTAADVAFASAITGAGSLYKTGNRTLTLAGSGIAYTGATTVNAGTLVLQDISSATFLARSITNNSLLEINTATADLNFGIAIAGAGSLIKTGPFTLTVSGPASNSYTGDTIVSEGTLNLNKTKGSAVVGNMYLSGQNGSTFTRVVGNSQISSSTVINFMGGYWPHFELLGHSVTVAGISDVFGTGVIENTQDESASAATLTVANSTDYLFAGIMRDHAGGAGTLALVKNGTGVLTLAGADSGSYTGGLTVNAGTLDYSGGALPVCAYVINGGTLNIGSLSPSVSSLRIVGGTLDGSGAITSGSTFLVQGGQVNAVLAGASRALTKSGTGTAILNNDNTYTGTTTVSAGTLQLGTGSTIGSVAGTIYVNSSGTLAVNRSDDVTYTSKVTGSGTLLKTGTGTLNMSSANTFNGKLVVNNGTLNYSGNSTLPAGTYTVTGGTLNTGALSKSIAGIQITGGAINGAGTLTSTTAYDVQAGSLNVILAGGSTIGLNKTGPGAAVLTAANTYAGLTKVSQGALRLAAAAQDAVFNLGGADILGGGIIFDYNGDTSPASMIRSLLTAGYNDGLWNTGKLKNSTAATSGLTLGWFDNGSSDVVVMATYAGDFNLDGTVNLADLDVWKSHIGVENTDWQAGDCNYDGEVNGLDLYLWKSHLGMTVSTGMLLGSSASVVPEPGTLSLLAAGLLGLLVFGWRKRK